MDINIGLVTLSLATLLYSAWIVAGQRKTIDKLTDKLMAKDYNEYKRHKEPFNDTKDAPKQRKAQSFYDDPSIDLDEDSIN